MKELIEMVSNKTNEMVTNGTVDAIIQKNIEESIEKAVESAFGWKGDFKKILEEKIIEAIGAAGRDVSIPEYNLFIAETVKKIFSDTLHKNAVEHLQREITERIPSLKKQEKNSTLIEKMRQLLETHMEEEDLGEAEQSIEVEESSDGRALYLTTNSTGLIDNKVKVTFYSFSHDNGLWHIGYIRDGGTTLTGHPINKARGAVSDLGELFYSYYAMGTKFEMDEEFEDIYVDRY